MHAPNRKLMRSALNRAAAVPQMSKSAYPTAGDSPRLNYARCYDDALFQMLPGGQPTAEMKRHPQKWALYYLPEGCSPKFHIIGEDSDWYALRNLVARTKDPKAKYAFEAMLLAWKERGPFSRETVREAYAALERLS